MEIIWSDMALHQLDGILDYVEEHLNIGPNVVYYNVDGEIINIMVIAHYRQSTVTVVKMINRFIEHHMP